MGNLVYENIATIESVTPSKVDNYIKFDLKTKDGESPSLIAEYGQYCKWLKSKKGSYNNVFSDFVKDFLDSSDGELSEIVDKDGNLYPDNDMPNNATNRMVGSSKFDLDKVYKQAIPKRTRMYYGGLGYGVATW